MVAAVSLVSIVEGTSLSESDDGNGTRPRERKRSVNAALAAEQELEWRFRCADHQDARGLKAQGYESGGGVVFDEAASNRLHERLHSWHQSQIVQRARRVDAALARMLPQDARDARAMYEPGRWRDLLSRAMLVSECAQMPVAAITLVGLLSSCPEPNLIQLFSKAHGGRPPASEARLLDWIEDAIRPKVVKGQTTRVQPPTWFSRARSWCEARRVEVLRAYVDARRGLRNEERAERERESAAMRAALSK